MIGELEFTPERASEGERERERDRQTETDRQRFCIRVLVLAV